MKASRVESENGREVVKVTIYVVMRRWKDARLRKKGWLISHTTDDVLAAHLWRDGNADNEYAEHFVQEVEMELPE
jgi:hypothetical protein